MGLAVNADTSRGWWEIVTQSADLSSDEIFELLSSSRRRCVIAYLLEHPEGATLQELAREIAAEENDCAVDDVTRKQRKSVYVSLHQTHISKLSEAGVIDRADDRIVPGDRAPALAPYFERPGEQDPWHMYYLTIVLVGGLALALAYLDVGVFATIEHITVSVAVFVAFAALTVVYTWARQAPALESRAFR